MSGKTRKLKKYSSGEAMENEKQAESLLEEIIDNLIEYDNGGSKDYSTHDIAEKCFKLRELIFEK